MVRKYYPTYLIILLTNLIITKHSLFIPLFILLLKSYLFSKGKEPLPQYQLDVLDSTSSESDTLPDIEPDDDLNYSEDSTSNFKKIYEWVNFYKFNSYSVKSLSFIWQTCTYSEKYADQNLTKLFEF